MHPEDHPTRRAPRLTAAVVAALLLAAGCGVSVNDDAGGPGPGVVARDGDTTDESEAGADASEDEDAAAPEDEDPAAPTDQDDEDAAPADEPAEVTVGELEDLLPTLDDVPDGYVVDVDDDGDDDDGDGDAGDEALAEACPELAELDDTVDNDGDDETAEVSFAGADDESLTVSLQPSTDAIDEEVWQQIVEAVQACEPVTYEDDGTDITVSLDAEEVGDLGEFGARLTYDISLAGNGLTLDVTSVIFLFVRDGVDATVGAVSGFDSSFEVVPGDEDVAEELAAALDQRIQDR